MAILKSSPGILSFIYDFDVNGGAQGVIQTGVFTPAGMVVSWISLNIITTVESGGAALIDIGTASDDGIFFQDEIAIIMLEGFIVPGTWIISDATPQANTLDSEELIMTIKDADLTAGKFICSALYYIPSEYNTASA